MKLFSNLISLFGVFAFLIILSAAQTAYCQTSAETQARTKRPNVSAIDRSVRPQDNFFQYANGAELKRITIPASKVEWGPLEELDFNNRKKIRAILEQSANGRFTQGSVEQRVGDFFASGMDSVAIEKRGFEPIRLYLDQIDQISSLSELLTYCAIHPLQGGDAFVAYSIFQDALNPTRHRFYLGQAGTGLPDKDYYTKTDEATVQLQEAYKTYITRLFALTGTDEAEARKKAAAILALETTLAASHLSRIELRDIPRQINIRTRKDLLTTYPNVDFINLFQKRAIQIDTLILAHPDYYKALNEQLPKADLQTLKDKVKLQLLTSAAPLLSSAFVQADFVFWQQALRGQKEPKDRWERIMRYTDEQMGDLLGQLYVAQHFKPEAKRRMLELVANLKTAFRRRIEQLDWMTAETRQEALRKLEAFTPKIGYADKWKKYEGVAINRADFFQNVQSLKQWKLTDDINRLSRPVDKAEWTITPPTVNAYYNPLNNEIVFPAGILQWPFFDNEADDALNYGAIGVVIGHEMTHGFDDQGRLFNYTGKFKNWWKKEDNDAFGKRSRQIVDQYNGFRVLNGIPVKGELTLGENIADLGGVAIAYDAFQLTQQAQKGEKLDEFTPNQRFFLSFAQMWCGKVREETMRLRIDTDPHSPYEFRTNGPLSNFEPFYKAFGVKPGDKLYRQQRTSIW